MNFGMAAVLMRGTKPVGNICNNCQRNYCRGKVCPSIHAEACTIISYYGKDINYSGARWHRQCLKEG
jgi:hypothetical protein